MDSTVVTGPWPASTQPRTHFGKRPALKLSALAGGLEGALDSALFPRDRVAEAARAAKAADVHPDLKLAVAAKVECLASLATQLANEMHGLKNGPAATKLAAISEMLETLAAECEP